MLHEFVVFFHLVHFDSPLNDGFGVVIVTVCVHEGAQILLLPSDGTLSQNSKKYVFNAAEGDTYVLCGNARNAFDHGVLCERQKRFAAKNQNFGAFSDSEMVREKGNTKRKGTRKNVGRESLNLRFCVHGNKPGMPFYVNDEISPVSLS